MIKRLVLYLILVIIGIGLGAYFFTGTEARKPLQFSGCEPVCFHTDEALGLLTSIGIRYASGYIPDKVMETDKTLAIKHPTSKIANHYLIIPKKDLKNLASVTEEDQVYIRDAIAVIQKIIADKNLKTFQIVSNGPGYQEATYLHFHLVSE